MPHPSPTIWLDGRHIGRSGGTGVYRYALELYNTLQRNDDFTVSWLLESGPKAQPRPGFWRFLKAITAQRPAIRAFHHPKWGDAYLARDLYRIAHVHYRYHRRLLSIRPPHPPTIMHWTFPLPVIMEGCINIVTVHDLIPITHPHLTGINTQRFTALLQALIEKNVHFVTVSETVRQQMLSHFALSPERVTTLYQSVSFDDATRQAIKKAPQIAPSDSFLVYGRVEKRKNIERILEAHARSQTKTPLVIIGPDGDDHPDCTPRGPTSQVIRLPWSDRLSLLRTLSEAKALLFPSLAEGFGLPIIEAMALNVPVITSRGGVTEEIAGGAALLVDPYDVSDITKKIIALDYLNQRDKGNLLITGYKNASRFNANIYPQWLKTL